MQQRFLPAYEMLNLRHGRATMLWPVVFMLRRVLFAIGVCALVENPEIQIILFMGPTMASMIVLASVKPLESASANELEIYNSFMLLAMSYCLMTFTPFVVDAQARY